MLHSIMGNAIEINNVSKIYTKVKALDNVSFSVPEGVLYGLIGPDGAGKSTLFNILTTLQHPDSGSAFVAGYDGGERTEGNSNGSRLYARAIFAISDLTVGKPRVFRIVVRSAGQETITI